jgi:hypothetical protein
MNTSIDNQRSYVINSFYITMILHELNEKIEWCFQNRNRVIINLYGEFHPIPDNQDVEVNHVAIIYDYTKDIFQIITSPITAEFSQDSFSKDHYDLLKSILPKVPKLG